MTSAYVAAFTFLQASGVRLTFEEFSEKTYVEAASLGGKSLLDDRALGELRHNMVLNTGGVDPGLDALRQAATKLAYENSYDRVRDYYDSLEDHGLDYLGDWLLDALGAEQTKLNRNTMRRFFVAGVARVFEPGAWANFMPIFSGKQRAGKSTFLRIIAREPALFTDTKILGLDAQRRQEALRGKHIVEIAEMEGWRSSTIEHLKALTSATHDYSRRVWGSYSHDQARRCVFACTTNEETPLRDPTGNFRFPVIRVGDRINLKKIRNNVDAIWADALALYKSGFSLELPNNLVHEVTSVQLGQMEHDPWVDALASVGGTVVNGNARVSYAQVFAHLGITVCRASPADARRASDAMVRNGWSLPKPCKHEGKTVRCFMKEGK